MKKNFLPQFLLFILIPLTCLTACSFSASGDIMPQSDYSSTPAVATNVPLSDKKNSAGKEENPLAIDLKDGSNTYAKKCSSCHGTGGAGNGPQAVQLPNPPTVLRDKEVGSQASPQKWFEVVDTGILEAYMPPFASLGSQERWNVVFYALSLSASPDLLAHGKRTYRVNCLICHGEQGGNGSLDFGRLDYWTNKSSTEVQEVIANGKPHEMQAFSDQLTPDDIHAAAVYMRTFSISPLPDVELLLAPQASPTAPAKVAVKGRIIHATGNSLPAGLRVVLEIYKNMEPVDKFETGVGDNGSYAFSDINLINGQFVLLSVIYKGVRFFSDIIPLADLQINSTTDLPITVYETGSDPSALTAEKVQIFINFKTPGKIQVVEMVTIRNPNPIVITSAGQGEPVLQFYLPEDTSNLQFQNGTLGDRFIHTDGGFGDTADVPPFPGQNQVLFSYDIPYEKNQAVLPVSIPLPVENLLVAAPVEGVRIKNAKLVDIGEREVQSVRLQLYQVNNLPANQKVDLVINGWPLSRAGIYTGSTGTLLFGTGVFVLTAAAAGIFIFRQQRSRQSIAVGEKANNRETTDDLLDAILAVEDGYHSGELSEDVFYRRREELKDRLREMIKDRGEGTTGGND